jgi:AcrR family transcriptional regulator
VTISDTSAKSARLPRGVRRQQLLAAAQEVFVANGYHAAAMDEIAERAGVSKPVLYQHFPSKLDLYLALLDISADEVLRRVKDALASTHDNKQRVAAIMKAYFDYIDDPAGSFRLIFENDLTNAEAVVQRLDRLTRDCAREVAHVISEDTGLPSEESMLLAVSLVGTAQTSARYWLQSQSSLPRDAASALVSTLEWRGISGFPRRESADHLSS